MSSSHVVFQPVPNSSSFVRQVFTECVEPVLHILDSRGVFSNCYAIVTPALGASALQALLEPLVQHRGKRDELLLGIKQIKVCHH